MFEQPLSLKHPNRAAVTRFKSRRLRTMFTSCKLDQLLDDWREFYIIRELFNLMTTVTRSVRGVSDFASLERSMPRYTLFFLDWDDATVGSMDVDCEDDASALVAAAEHKGDHADVEVLCGGRTVGRPATS